MFALIINSQVFALIVNSQVFALIISSRNYKFTGAFIGLSTLALGDYYAPFTHADIEQPPWSSRRRSVRYDMNVYSLGYIQTHVARWRLHYGPPHIVYPYARVYTRMVVSLQCGIYRTRVRQESTIISLLRLFVSC